MFVPFFVYFCTCFLFQSRLVHFFFISSLGIGYIAQCPEHLIFCQLFHNLCKISVQSTTLHIAVYGVQSFLINLFHRMIVRKLPLFSAFQVADLPTGAVQLVPRCIAATVFGVPCVGGQKPLAADFAFLWCMTNTQALKEIRPEHPHKGYIMDSLDELCNFSPGRMTDTY